MSDAAQKVTDAGNAPLRVTYPNRDLCAAERMLLTQCLKFWLNTVSGCSKATDAERLIAKLDHWDVTEQ